MDFKDLMVGDLVYVVRGYDKHLTIEKIKGVIEDEDKPYPVTIFTGETVSLNDIKPIPLTEEILVKNRFALDKSLAEIGTNVYTRPCPAGDLSVKIFHDGSIRFGFIKLTYVHTLQHLLRLCGIEKEIEL